MSQNLYWRPDVPPKGNGLSDDLKFALRGAFDGEHEITFNDTQYLRGMIAAGNDRIKKDCATLIEAIEKYGAIVLWLE